METKEEKKVGYPPKGFIRINFNIPEKYKRDFHIWSLQQGFNSMSDALRAFVESKVGKKE